MALSTKKTAAAAVIFFVAFFVATTAGSTPGRKRSTVGGRQFRLVLEDEDNNGAGVHSIHRRSNDEAFDIDPSIFDGLIPPESEQTNSTANKNTVLNPIADFVVRLVRKEIVKRGKQQIDIPDIYRTSHRGIGPLKIKVAFNASEGWFRNLASLQRTKDVVATRSGDNIVLEIGVGLKTMVVGYDKYVAKIGLLEPEGNITGRVSNNSLTIKFSVDISGHRCNVSLLDLTIDLLGKIKVELTGMGRMNWMYSKIVNWIANKYRYNIVPDAEEILQKNVQDLFGKLKCETEDTDVLWER